MREIFKIVQTHHNAFLFVFLFFIATNQNVYAVESLLDFKLEESAKLYVPKSKGLIVSNDTPLNISTSKGLLFNKQTVNDSSQSYRWTAIMHAQNNDAKNACIYIEKYIKSSLFVGFINNDVFKTIADSNEFKALERKYKTNLSIINIFYLFTSLIGFFIFIILNLKHNTKNTSKTLISIFVLMHSIFILDLFFFLSNLHYSFPHTLFMSLSFSFLYGPIIYFYYKMIVQNYKLRWMDSLHFIPTLIIFFVALPYYRLGSQEKLAMFLEISPLSTAVVYDVTFVFKLTSLVVYALLILRIYYKYSKNNKRLTSVKLIWQRWIATLVSIYVVLYCIYGLILVSEVLPKIPLLFHLQVVSMACMVLYIGYKAYVTPKIFMRGYFETENFKYKKSGLTYGFSQDLKERLVYLLEEEKIYRANDISLEKLSNRLETTRHNTSQVINEHFKLNFFELINRYRIKEAKEILRESQQKINIIDVAYEVGFNNKVTFNKSFKKIMSLTPTQYIASINC